MMNATTSLLSIKRLVSGLLALFALAALTMPATAQELGSGLEECSGGTLYYIAYPDTVKNTQDARFAANYPEEFFFYIYSPVDQQVRIGRAGGAGIVKNLVGGQVFEFDTKEIGVPLVTVINQPNTNVLRVESEFPVVVYAYLATRFGCAAYTPIPVEAWGTDYYAATWEGEFVRNVRPAGENNYDASEKVEAPAEVMIIAAYDDTRITIDPTGPLKNCVNCTNVELDAGEAYLVQSFVDTNTGQVEDQADIAGTYITSNKRIGVVSGNTRALLDPLAITTLAANSYKDLVVEWLAPADQHGTEFVFMPTWDDYRQRPNREIVREDELVRVYPTTQNETDIAYLNTQGQSVPTQQTGIQAKEFTHEKIGVLTLAIPYFTSSAGQAYQAPTAIAEFNGTTAGWGGNVGASFNSWSTYMVEMVPREQWVSYSPFKAPSYPSAMKHHLNVVTDTNSSDKIEVKIGNSPAIPFQFNGGKIAGTDLTWGSVVVNPGQDYVIEGEDGARFGGFVYGQWGGYELYRPGRTERDDDDKDKSVAGDGEDDDATIFHPSEYEENVAMMYGFPLVPSRCVLSPPDEYEVTIVQDCEEMCITIEAQNENPSGLKFIRLVPDRDSTFNARMEFVEPESAIALKEKNIAKAEVCVVAIDPLKDAQAVIEFRDRTREGKTQRVRFKYEAERVDINPAEGIDFGSLTINKPAGEEPIRITNPLDKDVVIKNLQFFFGTAQQNFEITRTDPEFDYSLESSDSVVLKSGETLTIWVDITPTEEDRIYEDSIIVQLGCVEVSVPLRAATVQPCLFVNDLDFGTLGTNSEKERELEICNNGDGVVTFHDSSASGGGDLISWIVTNFDIRSDDSTTLRNATLGPGECVSIYVTFASGSETGIYRDTARFWASTRECRDTSIWSARVTKPGPQIGEYDWRERWLSSDNPCTKNDTLEYQWTVQLSNNGDSDFRVDSLLIIGADAEDFRYGPNTQVQPGLVVRPDQSYDIDVFFKPMEERSYGARIIVYYTVTGTGDTGSTFGRLQGVGIESYATITDQSYARMLFTGPGADSETKTVTIESIGTRAVTITGITINGQDAADFGNVTVLAPSNNTPFTLAPGEAQDVEITFDPQDIDPLLKNATVDIEGDFAYAECSVTDSSGTLDASVYTLGAESDPLDFGSILTCYDRDGFVAVRNTGTDPVKITAVSPAMPADQFIVVDPDATLNLPVTLDPGEEFQIPARFTPEAPGNYSADVNITVMDTSETDIIAELTSTMIGEGRQITISLSIDEGYTQFPGLRLEVPVDLNADPDLPDEAQIRRFRVTINYDDGMMLIDDVELGSLFPQGDGWQLDEVERQPGYVTVEISNSNPNTFVQGEGQALNLTFITFIGDTAASELLPSHSITVGDFGATPYECVNWNYYNGSASLDSVCGLNFRLIEAFGAKYAPPTATPNVVQSATNVEFGVGLDAHTTIEIFNQQGDKVGVLVDRYLEPGEYAVTWDVRALPSGKYFLRMNSGHMRLSSEVMIQK